MRLGQPEPLELQERLRHIQEALFNLRFRLASGQVEDPKRVRKYRKAILEAGGSRPAMESFKAFRGREPSIDALLRHQGMA